jgi:hypothetical protein
VDVPYRRNRNPSTCVFLNINGCKHSNDHKYDTIWVIFNVLRVASWENGEVSSCSTDGRRISWHDRQRVVVSLIFFIFQGQRSKITEYMVPILLASQEGIYCMEITRYTFSGFWLLWHVYFIHAVYIKAHHIFLHYNLSHEKRQHPIHGPMGSVSGNLLATSVGRGQGPGRVGCLRSKVQPWLAGDAYQTTTTKWVSDGEGGAARAIRIRSMLDFKRWPKFFLKCYLTLL